VSTDVKDCLLSNLRLDHPRIPAFSYAWSVLVTWQRWRRGGHTIWSAMADIPENLCCMQTAWLCVL